MNDLVANVDELVKEFDEDFARRVEKFEEKVEILVDELSIGAIPIVSVAHAKKADEASYAAEADYAYEAGLANQAKLDELGQPIHLTYARMASFSVNTVIQDDESIRIGSLPIDASRIYGLYLETKNGKGFTSGFSVPFLQYRGHRTSEWVEVTGQGYFTTLYLTGEGLQRYNSTSQPHSIIHRCVFLTVRQSYDGVIYFQFGPNKSFQVEGNVTNINSHNLEIYGETIKTVQILYT